jgi:hypothetical protein
MLDQICIRYDHGVHSTPQVTDSVLRGSFDRQTIDDIGNSLRPDQVVAVASVSTVSPARFGSIRTP